jgi:hypothetical protein
LLSRLKKWLPQASSCWQAGAVIADPQLDTSFITLSQDLDPAIGRCSGVLASVVDQIQ